MNVSSAYCTRFLTSTTVQPGGPNGTKKDNYTQAIYLIIHMQLATSWCIIRMYRAQLNATRPFKCAMRSGNAHRNMHPQTHTYTHTHTETETFVHIQIHRNAQTETHKHTHRHTSTRQHINISITVLSRKINLRAKSYKRTHTHNKSPFVMDYI